MDANLDEQLMFFIKSDEDENARYGEVVTPHDDLWGVEPVTKKEELDELSLLSDDKDLLQDEENPIQRTSSYGIRAKLPEELMANNNLLRNKKVERNKWSDRNTRIFLDLWEVSAGELRGEGKNSHTHQKMVEQLKNNGIIVSAIDIKYKLDNMTRKYRLERKKVESSGGTLSRWEHYTRVHSIIGGYKPFNLSEVTMESTDLFQLSYEKAAKANDTSSSCNSPEESEAESPTELHSRKRKIDDGNNEEHDYRRRMLQLTEERNAAIQRLVVSTERMEERLCSFLAELQGQNNEKK